MPSLRRLKQKHKDFEEIYEILSEKLRMLSRRYTIETDTAVKFKLKEEIKECEEEIEEIEEKLDDIEEKIENYQRGNHSQPIKKPQNVDTLYKVLLKLGYWQQQQLFEKIVRTHQESHGAFLIHGNYHNYGQGWLANRLAFKVAQDLVYKKIVIDLHRRSLRTDMSSIWEEFAGRISLAEESSPGEIVTGLLKLWQSQHVLICFNNVDESIEDNLRDLIDNLWTGLVQKISQHQPSQFKLLIFFLDYQGLVRSWNIGFVTDYQPDFKTRLPFELPEIIPFCHKTIRTWLDHQEDYLPETLSDDKEQTVKILLAKKGIPEPTFRKICELWGCNWYDQEEKWFRL
ncbi:MAG: hypothetical protein F6J94_29850 [Moorea sp. SIO1F2]|uniref:hypothetical protein n=1 Tax=unclassified Moorena TaxID=2683338 RepID=UPI0013BD9D37|nr:MULTISPECIES: hypothetical protein [unclassified Moorena]NEO21945.1 hypothetical protein [Moorena sp. SIO4A5]NEQ61112.1 hypothetical protein [Moorena sp. SIO4A1]NET85940.1 hypothetical protein [Moorena sp. SIO1F2]